MQHLLSRISRITIPTYKIIIFGVVIRLVVSLFLTLQFDSFRIFMWSKSVADTGSILYGFVHTPGEQIYGKIYFQMIAGWMLFLNKLHLLDLRYLFDFRPFQPNGVGYLAGFPLAAPQLYQIIALKLVQFVFDLILLYFLVQLVRLLKLKHEKAVVLFWALNPLFIYVGYVFFQADLAMTAALTAAVYFAIRALMYPKIRWKLLSLLFFAAGTMIKQVPILIVPFALILFAESIWQFLLYAGSFALFYILLYQPWASDTIIFKKYFLVTPESTAIFGSGVFGFSLFFTLYFALFAAVFYLRKKIKTNPLYFLHVATLVLCILYLAEDPGMMLVQFNMWITPLLAVLAAYNSMYALFLFAPLVGFLKRILDDNSLLSGALTISFGEPLSNVFRYDTLINQFVQKDILSKIFSTLMSMSYLLLGIGLFYETWKKKVLTLIQKLFGQTRINLVIVTSLIFGIFVTVFLGEYLFMSHFAHLTNYQFTTVNKYVLQKKPLTVFIHNTDNHTLTGITLLVKSGSIMYDDPLIISLKDQNTGKILTTAKTNDYLLPVAKEDYYTITLPRAVTAKNIIASIYQEKGLNETDVFVSPDKLTQQKATYEQYDNFYKKGPISLSFSKEVFDINVRGQYSLQDEFGTLAKHLRAKPKFYMVFFGVIGLLIVILLFPMEVLIKFRRVH